MARTVGCLAASLACYNTPTIPFCFCNNKPIVWLVNVEKIIIHAFFRKIWCFSVLYLTINWIFPGAAFAFLAFFWGFQSEQCRLSLRINTKTWKTGCTSSGIQWGLSQCIIMDILRLSLADHLKECRRRQKARKKNPLFSPSHHLSHCINLLPPQRSSSVYFTQHPITWEDFFLS